MIRKQRSLSVISARFQILPCGSGWHCRRFRVLVISTIGDVLLRALPEKISFFRGYLRSIDYIFL